jgi:hypothetical protein
MRSDVDDVGDSDDGALRAPFGFPIQALPALLLHSNDAQQLIDMASAPLLATLSQDRITDRNQRELFELLWLFYQPLSLALYAIAIVYGAVTLCMRYRRGERLLVQWVAVGIVLGACVARFFFHLVDPFGMYFSDNQTVALVVYGIGTALYLCAFLFVCAMWTQLVYHRFSTVSLFSRKLLGTFVAGTAFLLLTCSLVPLFIGTSKRRRKRRRRHKEQQRED